MSVIEMVVDEKDDREVHKVGMVFSILAAEIIQVLDSIAWVRCASGNVFLVKPLLVPFLFRLIITAKLARLEHKL